jgi:hypothetical protein
MRIRRFRAPHGPEEEYTPEEIQASIENHGADRGDMLVQDPDTYWSLAEAHAAEIVARDRAKAEARREEERREKLGKTFLGRFILEFL